MHLVSEFEDADVVTGFPLSNDHSFIFFTAAVIKESPDSLKLMARILFVILLEVIRFS